VGEAAAMCHGELCRSGTHQLQVWAFRGNLWIAADRVAACCLPCLSFRGLLTKESKQWYLFEVVRSFRCDLICAFLYDPFLR